MPDHPPPDDPRSDAELIEAARGGEVAAFEALYRRYRDWTARLARRWAGSEADALDVLQDTFVWVLDAVPRLQLRARFTTVLFPVVRNLALARRRRGARQAGFDDAQEPADPTEPAEPLEDLAHALGALGEPQRAVVLLRFVDGLSLAEIAERLGVPLGTVKSRLHLALGALREDPAARRYFLED